jgi:hypothetical protein
VRFGGLRDNAGLLQAGPLARQTMAGIATTEKEHRDLTPCRSRRTPGMSIDINAIELDCASAHDRPWRGRAGKRRGKHERNDQQACDILQ